MKHHPFTGIWPLLSGKDYENLKADIVANGLRLPILTYQEQVLDGRNRERACEEAGILVRHEPAAVSSDEEALKLVVSLNMHRRHLTPEERAFAAEKLATLECGRPRKNTLSKERVVTSTQSLQAAAKAVGSNLAAANRARAIRNHGTEADVEDVLAGRASLTARAAQVTAKADTRRGPYKVKAKYASPRKDSRPSGSGEVLHLHRTPPLKVLKPEEVDPEFTGNPLEFAGTYGHAPVMTAEQYATMRFAILAGNWRAMGKYWRSLVHDARDVDANWLRSPKAYDVAKLREALALLEPKIVEARMLLDVAEAALEKKQQKA